MRNYFIDWKHTEIQQLEDAGQTHFYAIENQGEIQYLGLAYGLKLAEEVRESLEVFELADSDVKILTGTVIRNIHNKVDLQLTEEMLCLLVYQVKPNFNVICKRSYYGREGLMVHNRGVDDLPKIVRTDREYVSNSLLTGS